MKPLQALSLSLALVLSSTSVAPVLASQNNKENTQNGSIHHNDFGGNSEQEQNQGQAQGQGQLQGQGQSTDINNKNVGIQGQFSEVDTRDTNNNANFGVNKQGDQTQLGIQGQKNTQLGIQGQATDASTSSDAAAGNLNVIGVDSADRSHHEYDGRSEAIVYPDQIMANPSNGTTITNQSLICTPDGSHTVLTDSTTVPEHRTAFGLGVNISFVGGGFINYQNAGKLHKSQLPYVQAAVKGTHEQRIARLSQVGSNPLAQTMMKWNMTDRYMVGKSKDKDLVAAKAAAESDLATYTAYVAAGGDPSLLNCSSAMTPIEVDEPTEPDVVLAPVETPSEVAPGPVRGRW